eukprot:752414-Hanusia_phi.AAC.3
MLLPSLMYVGQSLSKDRSDEAENPEAKKKVVTGGLRPELSDRSRSIRNELFKDDPEELSKTEKKSSRFHLDSQEAWAAVPSGDAAQTGSVHLLGSSVTSCPRASSQTGASTCGARPWLSTRTGWGGIGFKVKEVAVVEGDKLGRAYLLCYRTPGDQLLRARWCPRAHCQRHEVSIEVMGTNVLAVAHRKRQATMSCNAKRSWCFRPSRDGSKCDGSGSRCMPEKISPNLTHLQDAYAKLQAEIDKRVQESSSNQARPVLSFTMHQSR